MAKKISGITIAINGDTSGLAKSLDDVTTQSVKLSKNLKTVDNLLKLDPSSTELLAQKQKLLADSIETTTKKLTALESAQEGVKAQFERGDIGTDEYIAFQNELVRTKKRLADLQNSAKSAGDGVQDLGNDAKSAGDDVANLESDASKLSTTLKSGLAGAAKFAAGAVAGVAAAAVGAIAALNGVAESTEEYRIAMGKINTAYESANMGTEAAKTAYTEFYKILGDTDTAVEAAQLLARLAKDEQDLTNWTKIAAGVAGTFGDALPIEGLIESANETAKVGQITGSLADALNWVGVSEDAFNEKLSEMSSESERNAYIMGTLTEQYNLASEAFYRNNDAIVKQRENQAALDASLSQIGTSVTNVKNTIVSDFMPAIASIAAGISDMLGGGSGDGLMTGITMIGQKIAEYAPQIGAAALSIVQTIGQTIVDNIGIITDSAIKIASELAVNITNPDAITALVGAAVTIITSVANAIVSNIPLLMETAPIIIDNLVQAIITVTPMLLQAAFEIISAVVNGLLSNRQLIDAAGIQIIQSLITGVISMCMAVYNAGVNIGQQIGNALKSFISKAATWGRDLIDNFVGGIKAKIGSVISAVKGIAQTVQDYIGFSEPDEGPLSNFHTYAPDMIDLFTQGIDKNAFKIRDQFTKSLSGLNVAANLAGGSMAKSAAPAISAPASINLNVNVGSIASDYDVQRMSNLMIDQISQGLEQLKMRQNASVGGAW